MSGPTMITEAIAQLEAALDHHAAVVAKYLGGSADRSIRAAAEITVREMLSPDRRIAYESALTVMEVCLIPADRYAADGECPEWWASPLGRITAQALDESEDVEIDVATAMAMLGIGRARVYQLLADGKLRRLGDGVSRASVVARLRQEGSR